MAGIGQRLQRHHHTGTSTGTLNPEDETAKPGQFTLRILPDAAKHAHNAVCLDGTSPGYYIRPGVGAGAHKFKIHMSGGGWCQDPMNCYWRAHIGPAVLGSSKNWSRPHPVDSATMPNPSKDWNIGDFGLLDQDTSKNAEFADWTAVWMRYCDGSSFTSDREEPLLVDPSKFNCSGHPCGGDPKPIWFRGKAIFEALFEDLMTVQSMEMATDVILSGTSAGGVGTYIHADHVRTMLPPTTKFAAVPDAGMFVNIPDFNGEMSFQMNVIAGVKLWTGGATNVSRYFTNSACLAAHPGQAWKCYMSQYIAPHIKAPLFIVNSMYDAAGLGTLGFPNASNITLNNATVLQRIQQYHTQYLDIVKAAVLSVPRNGGFLTSCNQHEEICRSEDYEGIHIKGIAMAGALGQWWKSWGRTKTQSVGAHVWVDVDWPNNPTCWTGPNDHGAC